MKEKIRICKYCKSEIKINSGLHNWKNLFRKPTFEDLIVLFIIIMMIVSAYSYKLDLNKIINYYENETYCTQNIQTQKINQPLLTNFSNLSINKDG